MRIQSTQTFTAALANYDRAAAIWQERGKWEADPNVTEGDIKRLETNMFSSTDSLLRTAATTSDDINRKLDVMLEHVDDDGRGFGWRMIERDINAMSRPDPGPDMGAAFAIWRTAWKDVALHDASDTYTDAEAQRHHDAMCGAIEAVFRVPCTTAGDFMVKAYVNLIWSAGHTNNLEGRKAGTGNTFDIDLMEIDSDSLLTDAYYRTVYDDLDHCDLGACLLSFGLIDFDPEQWFLAAARIGMSVRLIVNENGTQAIAFSLVASSDQLIDRLQREQRRLQRILSWNHREREEMLAAYISEHQADCILTVPAKAAA